MLYEAFATLMQACNVDEDLCGELTIAFIVNSVLIQKKLLWPAIVNSEVAKRR